MTALPKLRATPRAFTGPGAVAGRAPFRPGPTSEERRRTNARRAVVAGTVLLPLLRPTGPGNTAPVDIVLVLAVGAVALWAVKASQRFRLPYGAPVGLMIVAGAAAAARGAYPGQGLMTLAQDVLLLLWCAAVAMIGRDPDTLKAVIRAWSVTAIVSALLTVVGSAAHIPLLSGTTTRTGARAAFTLGDANLAANYFMLSLFIVAAARYPGGRTRRWASYLVLVVAMLLTGSNGAPLALAAGLSVAAAISLGRRRGLIYAAAAVAVGALVVLAATSVVNVNQLEARAARYGQLGKDSVGHSQESTSTRSTLLHETLNLYFHGPLLGRGPGSTKPTLHADQAPYVKEAHNDYTATLVERGVAGGLGLILLLAAVWVRAWSVLSRPREAATRGAVPNLAPLLGGLIAMAVAGAFYQVLHFRHLWAAFGILAALYASPAVVAASPDDEGDPWRDALPRRALPGAHARRLS